MTTKCNNSGNAKYFCITPFNANGTFSNRNTFTILLVIYTVTSLIGKIKQLIMDANGKKKVI